MAYKYNIVKLADKLFDDYRVVSSGKEIVAPCFFCQEGPKKKKLYISTETGAWTCFVCGKKGNLFQLLEELKRIKKGIDLSKFVSKETAKQISKSVVKEAIPWPEGYFPFSSDAKNSFAKKAREYLHNRGITDNLISIYRLGYCFEGPYAGRIIVPVFEKDRLVSFIARDFTGLSSRRILTPPGNGGAGIKNYVFRLDEAKKLKHLIICEGVFDAISAGTRGICIFGKTPTKIQLQKIIDAKPERITVALDPDAQKEAIQLATTLARYINDVRVAEFPEGEDANSVSKETLDNIFRNAVRYKGAGTFLLHNV